MSEIINKKYKYSELTGKIIGCAMKVHSALGNGFQEVIYQRCLAIEMEKQNLQFVRELEMKIFYEGVEVGTRAPLSVASTLRTLKHYALKRTDK